MIKSSYFLLLVVAFLGSCTNCEFQMKSHFDPLTFNGIVIEKYLDQENHLYPTIIVSESDNKEFLFPYERFSGKPFFDYVQVGDSIFKENGSRIIRTKRLNESKEFVFRCKE